MYTVNRHKLFAYVLPLMILLSPTFPNAIGMTGDYLVFVLLISVALVRLRLSKSYKINSIVGAYFVLAIILLSVSLWFDVLANYISASDIIEYLKVIAYFLFFISAYSIKGDVISCVYWQSRLIMAISLFSAIFAFLDVFDVLGMRSISLLAYKRDIPILNNKALVPFGQIYQFAAFMILPLSISLVDFLKSYRARSFFLFATFLFVVLLSQSRSSLVAVIFAIFVAVVISGKVRNLLLLALIVLGVVVFVFSYFEEIGLMFPYLVNGVSSLLDGSNSSANYRSDQIEYVIDSSYLIFGQGVSKNVYMFESLYSLYLYRYGVVFLGLFLVLCLVTSYFYWKSSSRCDCKQVQNFLLGSSVWFFVYPVAALSSAHHDTTKFSYIFYSLMGSAFLLYQSNKQEK